MTEEQIKEHVKEAMQVQQADLLKLVAENAYKFVRDQHNKSSTELLDKIDEEIDKSKKYDSHEWQNQINKSNFDALRQVQLMWERAERMVKATVPIPDHQELKVGSLKFIEQGKKLTHDRLRLLMFANKDG